MEASFKSWVAQTRADASGMFIGWYAQACRVEDDVAGRTARFFRLHVVEITAGEICVDSGKVLRVGERYVLRIPDGIPQIMLQLRTRVGWVLQTDGAAFLRAGLVPEPTP